ncbi:MAG: hypothetical protein [Circular genetic element sp.]|nr:MAG: hypothetical protein [Circular genetic element sp.]
MKKSTEFRSFAFTIRPLGGVQEDSDLEQSVTKLVAKYKGYVCYEKEDHERHLHGQIYFEKPKRKHDFNTQLNTICTRTVKEWSLEQRHVLHEGTVIAYNDDFYLNYCNKPDTVFLYQDLPVDTSQYYPSEEEQLAVQARSHAVDKTFHYLQELFEEDPPGKEHDYFQEHEVKEWLYNQMYIKKRIRVIEDKRKFNQRATALYHYISPKDAEAFRTF